MIHSPRNVSLVLIALGMAMSGCEGEFDGEFRHRSSLQRTTNGLVLHDDGGAGHAGMMSTNCPFETDFGLVTGDYQLPGDDEEVQDVGSHVLGPNSILAVQPGAIYVLNKVTGDYLTDSVEIDGAVAGRFFDEGIVALVAGEKGCFVDWIDDDGNVDSSASDGCSPGSFDVDPQTGTAYLGGSDGTLEIVTPDGSFDAETGGDLVAWDPKAEVTYVATLDGDVVVGIEPDGSTRWSTSLDGSVKVLESAGRRGAAAVMLEKADGSGLLVYLDGWTGDEITKLETPSAANALTASGDGSTIGMVLEDETHFFGVYLR